MKILQIILIIIINIIMDIEMRLISQDYQHNLSSEGQNKHSKSWLKAEIFLGKYDS